MTNNNQHPKQTILQHFIQNKTPSPKYPNTGKHPNNPQHQQNNTPSTNLSQNKKTQTQLILQLIQIITNNPQKTILTKPITQKYTILKN